MRTKLILGGLLGLFVTAAAADLAVLDGGGVSRTIFNYTCFTTKLCNATALIKSDGTEVTYGAGNVAASTPRVTIATDDAGLAALGALPLPVGTNVVGKFGVDQTTPGTTDSVSINTTNNGVNLVAKNTNGCAPLAEVAATASTNAGSLVAGAATVCSISVYNTTTTLYWLHLYNTAGTPTCNASIIRSYPIPPASASGQVGGQVISFGAYGTSWSTGLGRCITSGKDGTGNAAAGVYINVEAKS